MEIYGYVTREWKMLFLKLLHHGSSAHVSQYLNTRFSNRWVGRAGRSDIMATPTFLFNATRPFLMVIC
jgi:hypothetical protein